MDGKIITIEKIENITPGMRFMYAQAIKQHCKETGNCEICEDKERGQPCPYAGNPINWKV